MSSQNDGPESTEAKSEQKEEVPETSGESSEPTSPSNVKSKIVLLLKPAGDAPIMKKKKWVVERNRTIASISDFIKNFIKMATGESMFLYVNQSFAPSPDTEVGCIFDCFGSDGKLVLHYCRTQAWG